MPTFRRIARCFVTFLLFTPGIPAAAMAGDVLPAEPVDIGTGPQFVLDNYVVDNHFALKYKREAVRRVFHAPEKHAANPLIAGDGGYVTVLRGDDGRYRMWYQKSIIGDPKNGVSTQYGIAYAESDDGQQWARPELGLFEWGGSKQNNIVYKGIHGRRASSPCLLDLPEKDRRGFRYVMLYRETDGMRLVGSQDGIHWDRASDTRVAHIHSDTQNSLVYDPESREYVIYCRAKHIYRTFRGAILDTGASRRVARMTSPDLWTQWRSEPQTILIPDEVDAAENFNFFYGMPCRRYGGVYWGMLWPFRMNTAIHTELAFSRDGIRFERLPDRPQLIARGEEGAWDDGMTFASGWTEVGDEWRFYYGGWDGPHESRERTPGIGVATVRKEGLISLRGPAGGGVVITRKLLWPGGSLLLNADARDGELKVRLTDAGRKTIEGFDYDDCVPFDGDSTAQAVQWQDRSIDELAGQVIRLEFFLRDADLYTFRAAGR